MQQTKKCVRSWKKWEVDKNKTEKRKGVNMFLKKERWNICLFKLKQHYGWYCLKKKTVLTTTIYTSVQFIKWTCLVLVYNEN